MLAGLKVGGVCGHSACDAVTCGHFGFSGSAWTGGVVVNLTNQCTRASVRVRARVLATLWQRLLDYRPCMHPLSTGASTCISRGPFQPHLNLIKTLPVPTSSCSVSHKSVLKALFLFFGDGSPRPASGQGCFLGLGPWCTEPHHQHHLPHLRLDRSARITWVRSKTNRERPSQKPLYLFLWALCRRLVAQEETNNRHQC